VTSPRLWGFWTQGKLDMLRDYLPAFTIAAKNKARGVTTYLDLFAGQSENVARETGESIEGSPEMALRCDPPFTYLRLFELEHAIDLSKHLGTLFPGRDVDVIEGDCNEKLGAILEAGNLPRWAPTFAFIDPTGPDCWWSTLEQLASFKEGSRYKTELWMLFPVDMFTRFLRIDGGTVQDAHATRITRLFGTDEWTAAYRARLAGELDASAARFEYVNLMRWRLEEILGYKWTHSFDVRNTRRRLYSMIFATDNKAGNDIMSSIYSGAAKTFPEMAEEARQRRTAQQSLFSFPAKTGRYRHEPPLAPYGSADRRE